MKTRGGKSGVATGKAIIEMVNLMYQNDTASHFYEGLYKIILKEMCRRNIISITPDTRKPCHIDGCKIYKDHPCQGCGHLPMRVN